MVSFIKLNICFLHLFQMPQLAIHIAILLYFQKKFIKKKLQCYYEDELILLVELSLKEIHLC
jgi:hypothetical protein